MVRLAVAIALVVVTPYESTAASQTWPASLSVDDVVALAVRDSPVLSAKRHEYQAVQAAEVTAGLRPNPVASYAAEQLGNRNIDPQYTVTLGQTIELGGKRQRRLDSARAGSRVTAAELELRPDLKAAEAARVRARADRELARANAWWDITPQVEYQRIGNDNTFGVGLSMPLRVFDRTQGELARTTAEIERTQALREAAARRVLAEVDVAITQVTSEWDKLRRLHDVYLPKAQRARDTVEFAYRRGGASLLDFLDAQRTYRETTLEHVRAQGNYRTALDRLAAAVGYSGEN